MKILAIVYSFTPLHFPQTLLLLRWFKYLDEAGHDVTVLSVDPDSFAGPKDPGLERLVPRNVENIRIRSLENTLLYRVLQRAERLLVPLFQPFKKPWYGPARKVLKALPLRQYDVVLSCSQPPVCHLLGYDVKKKAGLPWVAYFSDPWADNPYRKNQPRRVQEYNRAWQREVVCSADALIAPTDEIRQMIVGGHRPEVREKAATLDHCFVPQWFQLRGAERPKDNGAAKIVLTGSFYGSRTPIPFLRMLAELNARHRIEGRIVLEFYGEMSDADLHHPIWPSVEGLAAFYGRVDYLTSLAKMREADLLLLIDAPAEKGTASVFFPLKLAEYLGSGRPIIGFTPENGASARILRETGDYVVDVNDAAGLADLLVRIADGRVSLKADPIPRAKYDYRHVGRQLADILERTRREGAERPKSRTTALFSRPL